MKIALLGNCQLQQIGWLLKAYFEQHQLDCEIVWYMPIFGLGDNKADIVPLFHAMAQADRIYGQYHDKRWNAFSSENLSKYFDLRIVPTLESPVSSPQMNYFSKGALNLNLYSVDFRMLELYLNGTTADHLPSVYAQVAVDERRRLNAIQNAASKYRSLHARGKTIFDYSEAYLQSMAGPIDPYFVHNHPNNAQLQWLTNAILEDAGIDLRVSLAQLPEILTDTIVPALNAQPDLRYRIRATEVGLNTAAKINYTFFSTYDREFLEEELERSNYRSVCKSLV